MTEEQAIEILKEIQETNRAWLIRTTEATCEKIYLRDIEAIETVLNMLKEKDKEIERYKQLYNKALDNTVTTAHSNMQKGK